MDKPQAESRLKTMMKTIFYTANAVLLLKRLYCNIAPIQKRQQLLNGL